MNHNSFIHTLIKKNPNNLLWGLSLSLLIIVLDQASKWWVVSTIKSTTLIIPITTYFNIVLTHNRGVSFGLFASDMPETRWLLIALTIIISFILIWWLKSAQTRTAMIAYGLIIGGAIGNITDRVLVGAVVDFLDFHIFGFHWPAFNLADTAICIGAISLILESIFFDKNSTDPEA